MEKTTCPMHRVLGYALADGVWVCRHCGLPQAQHETIRETIERGARS